MSKLRAYSKQEDKENYTHLIIQAFDPNDGESACGWVWLKSNCFIKPRYSHNREEVTCPDCLQEPL